MVLILCFRYFPSFIFIEIKKLKTIWKSLFSVIIDGDLIHVQTLGTVFEKGKKNVLLIAHFHVLLCNLIKANATFDRQQIGFIFSNKIDWQKVHFCCVIFVNYFLI